MSTNKTIPIIVIIWLGICQTLAFSKPLITIISPQPDAIIYSDIVTISGRVENIKELSVQQLKVPIKDQKQFQTTVSIPSYGKHTIKLQGNHPLTPVVKSIDLYHLRTFPDISNHWAKRYIEAMATLGLLKGAKGSDYFWPDGYITREEAAIFFLTARNIIPPLVKTSSFKDIFPKLLF